MPTSRVRAALAEEDRHQMTGSRERPKPKPKGKAPHGMAARALTAQEASERGDPKLRRLRALRGEFGEEERRKAQREGGK